MLGKWGWMYRDPSYNFDVEFISDTLADSPLAIMDYLLSPSENQLCERCKDLLDFSQSTEVKEPTVPNHLEGIHHKDSDAFYASCRLWVSNMLHFLSASSSCS